MVGLQGTLMNEMEHSVEALTPLTLCVFPRSKLYELYSQFPNLAFDITWLAAREEQLIDEHLVSLGRRNALERTAYLLLNLLCAGAGIAAGRRTAPCSFRSRSSIWPTRSACRWCTPTRR